MKNINIKNIILIASLFSILLIISGCANITGVNNNPGNTENQKISTDPNGIVISISPGTSDRIKVGKTATIIGSVKNVGGFDSDMPVVARIQACAALGATGDNDNYISEFIPASDVEKNNGRFALIELKGILAAAVEETCSITGDVCYTYSTQVVQDVGLVDMSKEYAPSGQGSPINIVSIKQDVYANEEDVASGNEQPKKRYEFEIFVENKGKGTVVKKSNYDRICNEQPLTQNDAGLLNVYSAKVFLGNIPLDCYDGEQKTDEFKIKYFDRQQKTDQNYMTCIIETEPEGINSDIYPKEGLKETRTLKIVLNYGYYFRASKNIEVVTT